MFDHAKQSVTYALKIASKKKKKKERKLKKIAVATADLIANKIADKITKVLKTSPQNSSETVTNEEEILKERHISPEQDSKLLMI